MTTLIVGGGVSGLAMAGFLPKSADYLLVEKEAELGGYCRTVYQDGFTWDYSGHFFHFQNPWLADRLHGALDASGLIKVDRRARVFVKDRYIDYPFQYNVHQLGTADFVNSVRDMYEVSLDRKRDFSSFKEMVYGRYGKTMAELFFIPYNEKLYSLPSDRLDPDAMGRFLPHVEFADMLNRMADAGIKADRPGYNAEFSYHRRGARAYVDALVSFTDTDRLHRNKACEEIDLANRRALIDGAWVSYERLAISAPLPTILDLAGVHEARDSLTANKVLVFNIGFDRPSTRPDHWVYYPGVEWTFFRIGHYDNIFGTDRMSLYVEVAFPQAAAIDVGSVFETVLSELRRAGVVADHRPVSWCAIVLDPAYVHITPGGQLLAAKYLAGLGEHGVHALGRYGRWQYCSIEDNILQARELVRSLALGEVYPAGGNQALCEVAT